MRAHKISDEQFTLDCINKEFSIANIELHFDTFEELCDWSKRNEDWFSHYSFATKEQHEEWKDYFYQHFYDWKPKYISKSIIKHEFEMFDLNYGLRNDWYTTSI